ncbi:hypothetical protein Sjap_002068 [Stephania japonica]|uniref:Uncharacterized protein n=1 Tax=Stephania japonica TaxID=461633 RepID=A0AAP0KL67_9MAGN
MGTMIGHVAPGLGFVIIGLWHLFNNTKINALKPNSFKSSPWFEFKFLRYLELYLIIFGTSLSISMELFIGPEKHQPLDPDWTIPSNHLHNFEHASISLSLLIYAIVAIILDKIRPKAHEGLTLFFAALAFSQQFFLFHLHSSDHMGVEGQYHLLLQSAIVVCLATTLMGIGLPNNFFVSFVRSLSIVFQGVWLFLMGIMLWTPSLISKGCFMNLEEGHYVVRCEGEHSLHRAKSLVNIQFSWFLSGLSIFALLFYLFVVKVYGQKVEYLSLESKEVYLDDESQDLEMQVKGLGESQSFIQIKKGMPPIDMER